MRAQCVLELPEDLDAAVVRDALSLVVSRHEILRTTFRRLPGMRVPAQVIHDRLDPQWQIEAREAAVAEDAIGELLDRDAAQPFDLEHGPVVRARLVSGRGHPHLLGLSTPAACADAASLRALVAELDALVRTPGEPTALPEPLQYADYAEWRSELLDGDEDEAAAQGRSFWQEQNAAISPALLHQRTSEGVGAVTRRVVVPLRPEDIAGRSDGEGALLEGCWHACVARLTGAAEFALVGLVGGRGHEELADAVGPFAQPAPIRTRVEDSTSFAEVMDQVRRARARAEQWQEYARPDVLAGLVAGCRIGFASADLRGAARPILALVARPAAVDLQLVWLGDATELQYDPAVYDREDVEQIAGHLAELVAAAAADSSAQVGSLRLVDEAARADLLSTLGGVTEAHYPETCIHHLFAEQAERTPERPAVASGERRLSYRELNEQANRLAHRLRELGVGSDVAVGLCMDRSPETIAAMLGILKAGGCYVPLNFEHPVGRLGHQLEEVKAIALVTQEALLDRLPPFTGTVICVDRDAAELEREPSSNPAVQGGPDDLVYIMYTSGSTGLPKGVAVTHRNLVDYTTSIVGRLDAGKPESGGLSFAAVSAISTDLGNTCIFPALVSGGLLHLIPPEVSMDGALFAAYLEAHPVDVLKVTPSHLGALVAAAEPRAVMPRRSLVLGGEAVSWELVDRLAAARPECRILNHYGPTETTVGSCVFEVDTANPRRRPPTVPIGHPLPNTRAVVLDSRLEPQPVGVPGELCLGGTGVARGYVEQPEQTASVFVADPFAVDSGARLYRTGDRARYLRDGTIEFLGRLDDQVKIRGYRVEPAEIEAVLIQHPSVGQAAVVARPAEDGELRLLAYIVTTGKPGGEELQAFARESLPAYMVPSRFVPLDALPFTGSGKVDRRALPDPAEIETGADYVAPRTPLEQGLARIWEEVLRVEGVGVNDDFFALGGHSLLATQVVIRIRNAYTDIPLHSIFDAPTVAGLAEVVLSAALETDTGSA